MKKKDLSITFGLGLLILCIGACIYFVGGVSATSSPIKEYEYIGNYNQLITSFRNYASIDSNISFKITDKVGYKEVGYAEYATIETIKNKHSLTYEIKIDEGDTTNTNIKLIMAYDKTINLGGYGIKATGIKELVDYFEKKILVDLKNTQHIDIKLLKTSSFNIY